MSFQEVFDPGGSKTINTDENQLFARASKHNILRLMRF